MTLAFQALLIILALLPGFLALYSYGGGINRDAHVSLSFRGVTTRSAAALVVASLLHTTWLSATTYLFAPLQGLQVHFEHIVYLLSTDSGPEKSAALQSAASHPWQIALYFISLFFASFLVGRGLQSAVRRLRLDHKFEALRFRNYWHYLLEGEAFLLDSRYELENENDPERLKPDAVFASITVQMDGTNYLYGGIIENYWIDDNYDLQRVLLSSATRRELINDRGPETPRTNQSEDDRYYEIEGDYFLIWTKNVQTINIDYIYIGQPSDQLSLFDDQN